LETSDGAEHALCRGKRSENFVEVGSIACAETNVPRDQLDMGGHLELIAIRLDGSEIPVKGLPAEISLGVRRIAAFGGRLVFTA
jgi:hypothetical protein